MTKVQNSIVLRWLHMALWILVGFGPARASAVTLDFFPSVQNVELGQQATVDIYVRDLAGSRVAAFDFNVEYDPSILSVNNVVFGTGLGGPQDSFQDVQMPSANQVNVAELAYAFDLSPFQDGVSDLLLFSLVFDAVAVGTSALGFSENILGMAGGYLVDDLGLPLVPVVTAGGTISVVPRPVATPEPGSMFMLTIGFAGFLVLMRRKKSSLHNRLAG